MAVFVCQNGFNAGELSDKLLSRTDISQYSRGCRVLKNFIPTPYGSVERRPGTEFLNYIQGEYARIIPFVVSSEISFIVVFGHLTIDFYRRDGSRINGVSISSPYASSEIDAIQYIQSADVMTLVHGNHPVMEIRRNGEESFEFSPKTYEFPPLMEENTDDTRYAALFSAMMLPESTDNSFVQMYYNSEAITDRNIKGNYGVLCATSGMFTQASIGSQIQISYNRGNGSDISGSFTSNTESNSINVYGTWTFVTHGTWSGTVTIERKVVPEGGNPSSDGLWSTYLSFSSNNDNNVSTSGIETDENSYYRVKMSSYNQASSGTIRACNYNLHCSASTRSGIVEVIFVQPTIQKIKHAIEESGEYITDPDDSTVCAYAFVRILKKCGWTNYLYGANNQTSTLVFNFITAFPSSLTDNQKALLMSQSLYCASFEWAEGAWSNRRGYPCSVSFYEERMFFGGTRSQPQTIWATKTGDWDNFLLGSDDDSGLCLSLSSDTINCVEWMVQHDALVVGTLDAEWTISGSERGTSLTPTNLRIRRQSVFGASTVPGQMAGDVVLFVQRQGKKIREFVYSWEKDGYQCQDLTLLSDHICRSGIKSVFLQRLPDHILWCILEDGTMASMTYDRSQEVVAWSRHDTFGEFLSGICLPEYGEDRIYFLCRRNLYNSSSGVIEQRLVLEVMGKREFQDMNSCLYSDCSIVHSSTSKFSSVGVGVLRGNTVCILADGAVHRDRDVEGNSLVLDESVNHVSVGLKYESVLSPMPAEVDAQDGTTFSRRKSICDIRIRFYDSLGGEVKAGNDSYQAICSFDMDSDVIGKYVLPKSGTERIQVMGGFVDDVDVRVRQTYPLPLNIQSIAMKFEVSE